MKKLTILAALLCTGFIILAQDTDEENIKKLIQTESNAFASRNIEAMKSTWLNNANTSMTLISRFGQNTIRGTDSICSVAESILKQNPDPIKLTFENFIISTNGNSAMAEYDGTLTFSTNQPDLFPYSNVQRFHSNEILQKENSQWKVVSVIRRLLPADNKDHQIELDLNQSGYELLSVNKINEAIEVFKLNVKLYPNSHNTFDSLGEAYAIAGNKKLAIENYEKCIKLNPKSTTAIAALAKLKQK